MLGNFTYSNPTILYFGKDALDNLSCELKKYGSKVMFVYGGGSIKKTGLYDKIINILQDNKKTIIEDAGVMPNPTLEKLYEGAKIARENEVDLILVVGGGSCIDYAKAVSASAYCKEDPWEKYFVKSVEVDNKVIPIGTVLTMVGTGSEMNGNSVITNTKEKLKLDSSFKDYLFPKFSILNPQFTYTLPKKQMVAGIYDIMCHILEQYFSGKDDCTSDYIMEGLLRSLIHSAKIAVEDPENYEARSNIMWIATWALNTLVEKGKTTDWMVHMIGHSISAITNATHGMTLAGVSMAYYHHIMNDGIERFKRYAVNVWNISPISKSDVQIAEEGLCAMETFMKNIGVSLNITELGVTKEMIPEIVKGVVILDGGYRVLTPKEIEKILEESL